jgi:hypothetical protein
MAKEFKPRVQAFFERVRKNEEENVSQEFGKLLEASADPNSANLFVLLEEARNSGVAAKERFLRQDAARSSVDHSCNS